jgi:hypothetical protein
VYIQRDKANFADRTQPKEFEMLSAEARDAHIIATAAKWTAFAFNGRDDRRRLDFDNKADAFAGAERLAREIRKPALVYAVAANGQQALAGTVKP